MDNGDRPIRTSSVSKGKVKTFDEDDRVDIQDPHHDGLVITLFISNHFVRRILIDGGSSVNIIQLDVLKKMNIPESDIIPRSSVLVGFSGETKNTLGTSNSQSILKGYILTKNFVLLIVYLVVTLSLAGLGYIT